jgi:hypothetical protein
LAGLSQTKAEAKIAKRAIMLHSFFQRLSFRKGMALSLQERHLLNKLIVRTMLAHVRQARLVGISHKFDVIVGGTARGGGPRAA